MRTQELHVLLLNEQVEAWRPTPALDLGNGLFELMVPLDYNAEDEIWEFPPTSVVRAGQAMLYETTLAAPVWVAVAA